MSVGKAPQKLITSYEHKRRTSFRN